MARIDRAIYELITGDAACAALVGTRVYPLVIPQNAALPAACYQTITTQRDSALSAADGPNLTPAARIQITLKAANHEQAVVCGDALRKRLDGYAGTASGTRIAGVWLENEYDGFNLDSKSYTVRQDYRVQFYEE